MRMHNFIYELKVLYTNAYCSLLLFSLTDGLEEEEKENREQVPLDEKPPIKTSRGKTRRHKAAKPVQSEPGIPSTAAVQRERQNIHVTEGGAEEEMNLMQVTSVLKDLQSLSTALLNMDRETDDSQHSL